MKTSDAYRFWLGLGLIGVTGCTGPGFEPPFGGDDATSASANDSIPAGREAVTPAAGAAIPPAVTADSATSGQGMAGAASTASGTPAGGDLPMDMAATNATGAAPAAGAMGAPVTAAPPTEPMTPGAGMLSGEEAAAAGADAAAACPEVALLSVDGCNVSLDWPVATALPGVLTLTVTEPAVPGSMAAGTAVSEVAGVEACESGGYYWLVAPGLEEAPVLVLCQNTCDLITAGAELSPVLTCAESDAGMPGDTMGTREDVVETVPTP